MSRPLHRVQRFLRELKRRNVYRVAVAYAVVAFVVWQAASLLFPALRFPGWTTDFVIVLTLLGFPIALVLAWAFEMTAEGVRRTPEAGAAAGERLSGGSGPGTAYRALVGLGLVGAAAVGGWYLVGAGGESESAMGSRSIAVLPFEELGKEEAGVFTEGMHDALLTRLSNVSGLKVISRTAVQQYRDTDLTTGEIARELGVKWVLEGGVQEMGDQIQVNAQLIDPRTETHAWSETYRRDLSAEELFDLQSDITMKIARSLEARLSPEEKQQVERRPTGNLDAYRLYVKGRSRLDTRTEQGMRRAVDYFQQAIREDSTFALAWAGLADAVGLFREKAYASPEGPLPDHERTARRALELDADLAEARASMGLVHFDKKNGPEALRELERAVDLKPSYAQAHHWLGLLQFDLGRLDEAREHVSLAVELNPRHAAARGVLFWIYTVEGELEKAERQLQRRTSLARRERQDLEAFFLYHAARWDELERLVRDWESENEEDGPPPYGRFLLARIAIARGDTAAAREQLEAIRQEDPADFRYLAEGLVHAALGEEDSTFAAWHRIQAEEWPESHTRLLRYYQSDILGPLRDDPRYQELIRQVNRAWGLNPDGSLPDGAN